MGLGRPGRPRPGPRRPGRPGGSDVGCPCGDPFGRVAASFLGGLGREGTPRLDAVPIEFFRSPSRARAVMIRPGDWAEQVLPDRPDRDEPPGAATWRPPPTTSASRGDGSLLGRSSPSNTATGSSARRGRTWALPAHGRRPLGGDPGSPPENPSIPVLQGLATDSSTETGAAKHASRGTIAGLMGLVLIASLAMAALRMASGAWSGGVFLATCGLPALAVVGVLCGGDHEPVALSHRGQARRRRDP